MRLSSSDMTCSTFILVEYAPRLGNFMVKVGPYLYFFPASRVLLSSELKSNRAVSLRRSNGMLILKPIDWRSVKARLPKLTSLLRSNVLLAINVVEKLSPIHDTDVSRPAKDAEESIAPVREAVIIPIYPSSGNLPSKFNPASYI